MIAARTVALQGIVAVLVSLASLWAATQWAASMLGHQPALGPALLDLGIVNMGAAFGLQSLAGFVIGQWPQMGGRYPDKAHQAALAIGLALQLAALVWFTVPRRRRPLPSLQHAIARMALPRSVAASPAYPVPLARLSRRMAPVPRRIVRRRGAAAASASVCAALATLITLLAPPGEAKRHLAAAALLHAVEPGPLAGRARGHFSSSGTGDTEAPRC